FSSATLTSLSFLLRFSLPLVFSFFFYCSVAHRALPSFPTRRSSDLTTTRARRWPPWPPPPVPPWWASTAPPWWSAPTSPPIGSRSEEHTSELQSRFDLVCRLLLEKKKNKTRRDRGDIRQTRCERNSS